MNVVQYFRVVRRRWKLVAALAAIGAIAAFALAPRPKSLTALDGPSTYVATHTLFANAAAQAGGSGSAPPVTLNQAPLLVTGGDVVDRVAEATGVDPNDLLPNVIARAEPSLNTVDITYRDGDGERAAQIADEFAVQLTQAINDLEAERTQQQVSVLQEQRNQLQFIIDTLEGDPADPVFDSRRLALLEQLKNVDAQLQQANQLPGTDPFLLTLRSATPVAVTEAEYEALVAAASTPTNSRSQDNDTSLQTQSDLIADRGQAGVNPFLAAIGGALLGALIGIGIALAINRLDPRLFTKEDTETATGFPVVAEVPNLDRTQRQTIAIVSQDAPYSRYAEAFRALRSSILFVQHTGRVPGVPPTAEPLGAPGPADPAADDQPAEKLGTTIMVTSPGPGEGKTTTVANLATAMAEDGSRVLVVNCDFRRPRLHQYFDAPHEMRKVSNTKVPGVKLVSGVVADHQKASPAEVLAAQRHLVTTARSMFDFILLDTAPILTTTDASEVLSVTDMVIVICRAGKTTEESADRAAELLERFQAPVIGGVLVGASDAPSSRYYYYYSDDASSPAPSDSPADVDPFSSLRSSTDDSDSDSDSKSKSESDSDSDERESERRDDVGDPADASTT